MQNVDVSDLVVGPASETFTLIAGPCVIEDRSLVLDIAQQLLEQVGSPLVFKASFDKANRSSARSFRGPGLISGLETLAMVRELGVPVTTDVHLPDQAAPVAEVVDLLQVPAFLCRQTDLLEACARTGKPVNVKKGQFLAPWDMEQVVQKLRDFGAVGVMLTERGTSFGYNRLVSDLRSLPQMRALGVPVCFDATHSVQEPGGHGATSGGQSALAPALARAAVAVGVDAVFMEVHPDPASALSDGPNMIPLDEVAALVTTLRALHTVLREA